MRVLETQSFERLGGVRSIHTHVRFIGATNRDLEALIGEGKLCEDFYFSIQVLPLHLPPLREHPEDIPHLAQHVLHCIRQRTGRRLEGFTRGAVERLLRHPWPGNIRELQNTIERAAVLYGEEVVLGERQIAHALGGADGLPAGGGQVRPVAGVPLNQRQLAILSCLAGSREGMVLKEVLAPLPAGRSGGRSTRTLQNDLGKLTEAGLLSWVKQGSARSYRLTPEGERLAVT